jgi:hypothetical protein
MFALRLVLFEIRPSPLLPTEICHRPLPEEYLEEDQTEPILISKLSLDRTTDIKHSNSESAESHKGADAQDET